MLSHSREFAFISGLFSYRSVLQQNLTAGPHRCGLPAASNRDTMTP